MKETVPSLSDQRTAIRKVVRAFAWIDRIAGDLHDLNGCPASGSSLRGICD
jgi:hypothetical protein